MPAMAGELITGELAYDGGRGVTVYLPPDPPDAVVFAADGAWHTERLGAVLEDAGASSTLVVGAHGRADDEERLREYVPGFDPVRFAAHERFFVEDVPRWLSARLGVALPCDRTSVWGASLGGELALALGLRHPDRYGAVFSLSPGAGYRPPAELPDPLPRVYLAAGTQEPFFHENATRWADALRDAGRDVVMTTREGGHGDAFWSGELPSMLAWAFGR